MEFINALKEVGIVLQLFLHWTISLHWYWIALIGFVVFSCVFMWVLDPLINGYQKPFKWNDSLVRLSLPSDPEGSPPLGTTILLLCLWGIMWLYMHYIFHFPLIFLKIFGIGLLLSAIGPVIFIIYYCGYTFLPLIIILLVTIQWLALKNISIGLPDLPPHYIFDWWGHGWQSHSVHHMHFIPLPNFTMNPTRYEINVNQYLYIAILYFLYTGFLINIINFIKWKYLYKYDADAADLSSSKEHINRGSYHIHQPMLGKYKNTNPDLTHELKNIGFSDRAIAHLLSQYSSIRLLDILDDIQQRTDIDNPKEYVMATLEGRNSDES